MNSQRHGGGFTLIELLITVLVVAILAAIAYPMYTGYVVRGKLGEMTAALADLRVRMEQYLADNRNYGTTAGACPAAVAMPASQNFTYTCRWGATNSNLSYLIAATGNAGQGLGAAGDYTYTLTQAVGAAGPSRVTVKFAGDTVNAACWLTKKGQSC